MKTKTSYIPQMRLRTDMTAGESVTACQRNLEHWTNQLEKKCSKRASGGAPGYAPYAETEMKPWQAGSV